MGDTMDGLRFHDFTLRSYTVSDTESGPRIDLELALDKANVTIESRITFGSVVAYRFTHTQGAIVTDIREVDLKALAHADEKFLSRCAMRLGLPYWTGDVEDYIEALRHQGTRAWRINSAIGFEA